MALFLEWDAVLADIGREGKTVTESLMPEATAVAKLYNLNDTKRLQNAMVTVVLHCKKVEFPCLQKYENMTAAVLAGETWASSFNHTKVLRFDNPTNAWRWVLQHLENRPLRWSSTTFRLINEEVSGVLTQEGTFTTASVENVVRVFYKYVHLQGDVDLKLEGLIYYVCGMAKMGKASRTWIRTTLLQIRQEGVSLPINLNDDVIMHVWEYYGNRFHPEDDKWPLLFEHLKAECEARSLVTLAVLAQSTAGYGSTVMGIIQDAMRVAKNFNWALISNAAQNETFRVLHVEMEEWEKDKEEFNRDPWRMFKSNTAGNSKKYCNLGYLSKKLLLVHGVQSLNKYEGLDNSYSNIVSRKIFIDRLVDKYKHSYFQRQVLT